MCSLVMGQSVGDKCLVFFGTGWDAGNLFAHLNRVVIEGSRGVGKRVHRVLVHKIRQPNYNKNNLNDMYK